ncbi:Aldehyde dehydrogenase C-terminal [Penicillium cosmopolitanum]|uniref:aldehyde dehydrogenase (NAD(+)) n=1 Tax=Penicillium cosmopolitanum TaxID=1131564 RepID=A0A9X0BF37_9EURO|nr:Aldehyde dehydrogenase C-terminal [Penicillium cosmopolitanum]KAJ5414785.1 Aldehyde dehydrogenase C-terminal [Penicillium cosmopolitanum]
MSAVYYLWVAGKCQPGKEDLIPIENPATGEIFAKCHAASEEDVDNAVQIAHSAYKSGIWSRASRHKRAEVLENCAGCLEEALPELIDFEVKQTGRVVREMKAQVPSLVRWFQYYASLLRVEERSVLPTTGKLHNFTERLPLGVVVQITSFNHPLLIAVKKLAPALAAGNSVITKPSELTPLTTLLLGRILQRAGIPDGVFTVLPGFGSKTGRFLVSHPLVRKVDVTGSTDAGKAIGALVGGNLCRYTAELGGKAPLLLFHDADIDVAVNGVAFGSYIASGQTCVASTRILVDNRILDQVLQKLKTKVESITAQIGSPTNIDSVMGPLISEKQMIKVQELVDDAVENGAAIPLAGGKRLVGRSSLDGSNLSKGYFFEPTVLVPGRKDLTTASIWRREAFGPVIVVLGFDTEEQAVYLANDTDFGLGAGIWTKDLSRAFRISEMIEAGIVWVNTHHRNDPSSPWGGAKSASGVGSENGVDAYHDYTSTKSTIINFARPEESLDMDDWFGKSAKNVRYG